MVFEMVRTFEAERHLEREMLRQIRWRSLSSCMASAGGELPASSNKWAAETARREIKMPSKSEVP